MRINKKRLESGNTLEFYTAKGKNLSLYKTGKVYTIELNGLSFASGSNYGIIRGMLSALMIR